MERFGSRSTFQVIGATSTEYGVVGPFPGDVVLDTLRFGVTSSTVGAPTVAYGVSRMNAANAESLGAATPLIGRSDTKQDGLNAMIARAETTGVNLLASEPRVELQEAGLYVVFAVNNPIAATVNFWIEVTYVPSEALRLGRMLLPGEAEQG